MQPQGELTQTGTWQGPGGVVFEFATTANLKAPALKTLFAYWLAKSAGRIGPSRDDINPTDIPAILPNIHMHDVLDGGRAFRARLIGTQIVAAIGDDQTNRIFTESENDLVGARVFAAMSAVVTHKRPIRGTARHAAAPRLDFLSAESVFLPLSSDGQKVNKLLACTIFSQPQSLL